MNGVILNISTDEAATEFPRVDFEINALIRCAPWFTVATFPQSNQLYQFAQEYSFNTEEWPDSIFTALPLL